MEVRRRRRRRCRRRTRPTSSRDRSAWTPCRRSACSGSWRRWSRGIWRRRRRRCRRRTRPASSRADGVAAMPTMAWLSATPPVEPWSAAPPEKIAAVGRDQPVAGVRILCRAHRRTDDDGRGCATHRGGGGCERGGHEADHDCDHGDEHHEYTTCLRHVRSFRSCPSGRDRRDVRRDAGPDTRARHARPCSHTCHRRVTPGERRAFGPDRGSGDGQCALHEVVDVAVELVRAGRGGRGERRGLARVDRHVEATPVLA